VSCALCLNARALLLIPKPIVPWKSRATHVARLAWRSEYPVDAIPSRPSSGVVAAPGRHKTITCLHLCIFSRIATLKVKA